MHRQVAIIAALAAGSGFANDWARTFAVAGRPELRIETDDASVTVRTWDENRIAVRVTTAGWKIGPGEVEVGQSQAGNRVEITVRTSRRRFPFFSVGMHSIEVDVQAPRQIESDIRTGDGHMLVRGRLDSMTLRSGDGGIDAEVLPGSKIASSWRVESGDGSVTVRLPRDFPADLDLHTGDGRISVDFPLATTFGGRSDHDLRARLNAGGAWFYIRTGDGSIRIGRL